MAITLDRPKLRLYNADCLDALKELEDCSVDSVVTDPPAGIGFMGKEWDDFRRARNEADAGRDDVFGRTSKTGPEYGRCDRENFIGFLSGVMKECLRVLKPGGHAVVWSIPRTSHWTAWALEDAGFEVRDCVLHLFGCLSDDTEILIDGQWEPYHKAVSGRTALCYNADDDTFSWQPIQELYVYDYDDTAYRIQSDHTDQIVSRNHRCLVERGGVYEFTEAESLAQEQEARVPILESMRGLLEALPVPGQVASGSKQNVFADVRGPANVTEQDRQESGAASSLAQEEVQALQKACGTSPQGSCTEQVYLLQQVMPSEGKRKASSTVLCERQGEEVPCEGTSGSKESGLEGRRNCLSQARELQGRSVCEMPCRVSADGEEGRLRDGASPDRRASDRTMPTEARSGSPRRPQALEQSSEQSGSLCVEQRPQAVRTSRYAVADLARITPVHYRGIVWCVRVPTGAFVARRKGKVFVTGNSGFPKSLDVSKAIDKAAGRTGIGLIEIKNQLASIFDASGKSRKQIDQECGFRASNYLSTAADWKRPDPWSGVLPSKDKWETIRRVVGCGDAIGRQLDEWFSSAEREILGYRRVQPGVAFSSDGPSELPITAPVTEAAKQWDGWGTALKPAAEFWWLCRKPLEGTVAANVQKWGTGALNIDGCRVEAADGVPQFTHRQEPSRNAYGDGKNGSNRTGEIDTQTGRWPANVTHDGSEEVLAEFPDAPGQQRESSDADRSRANVYGDPVDGGKVYEPRFDSGSAARFFYCAKASSSERGRFNDHPTVKPIDLMRWLCRLVTPPDGTVLDCFAGSGSTLLAAREEGFKAIGIEREAHYCEIIARRLVQDTLF